MKRQKRSILILYSNRGTTATVIAILIATFVGFVALVVDLGYLYVTRNELQNVADAAALGATRKLGYLYENMTTAQMQSYVCNPPDLITVAQEIALLNEAGGKAITVNSDDVDIGKWTSSSKTFTETLDQPNSVRVTARRDGLANNPITTFFASILGTDTIPVIAVATAALTGVSRLEPGGLITPIGISKHWFSKPEYCDQPIKFYPTNTSEGCAGWHTFDQGANANNLRSIIDGIKGGTYVSPEVISGETILNFIGGNIANALNNFDELFNYMKTRDSDSDDDTWTATVVVYDRNDCSNPNSPTLIVGFATAVISEVLSPPDGQLVNAEVICEIIEEGRGGGEDYGTMGSIPGLVQ